MKTFRYLIAGLLLLAALPSQSKEEEISVSRSWGKLSGTLTVPDEGSDAAVLIIAGSGPTDRNGNSGSKKRESPRSATTNRASEAAVTKIRNFTNRKTGCAWPTTSPTPKP